MRYTILTLFPSMFDGFFSESIVKRAINKKLIHIEIENIRNFTHDIHKSVDDYPYGGDPGMVLCPQPLADAIKHIRERNGSYTPKVIYVSPHGELFTHQVAHQLSQEQGIIFLCGRYKGIDARIEQKYIDQEISIGDYILSGGEIAAMVIIDAVTRLLPNVLGNPHSASKDSFYNGLLGYPHYTRPEVFEGMRVPEELLSGNHAVIREWQHSKAVELTKKLRPDLWERYCQFNKNEI